ncbi:MAG: serine/threonine protein kinase, partial [Deltaproteobacteria bacterium]|nr:serine/threonine protein kinase [Deltaproteobacteria bacterium]
ALVLGAVIWTLRGRSELEVRIKTDPAGKDEAFCIEINHSSARPSVAEPAAFRAQLAQAGQEVRRRGATLVGKVTRFRLAPGTWDVHLYGVYERGGEQRTLGPSCSQRVTLGRGRSTPLTFDLVPDSAEVRITIYDVNRGRVGLWLDDREHEKILTNGDGEAVLFAPIGSHTLKIEARGMLLEQPLVITSPRIERLQINIERERRLAEVSGGLSLKRTHAAGSAPSPERDLQLRAEEDPAPRAPVAADPAPVAAGAATLPMASAPASARPAAPAAPAAPGMLLGRYRIVAELGRGAMGVVYRAHDTNLEREVAIKAMSSELRANPVALNLFTQEAKALAQLNHPNIVAVYDQATDGDDTYMMMELVEGTTLEAVLAERGAVPWRRALGVIDQLCAGLAYAHARKVIHRDIKPANVFVTPDGRVKLGDFGLARVMRELAIRRTEIRGTPLYMAPEQITGTNVGHRADLYAVGCTLFELVTGQPPFVDGDILYHQMNTPPPRASALRPELPASFDELVLACLAKAPEDRIATADDIRTQLRVVLQTP